MVGTEKCQYFITDLQLKAGTVVPNMCLFLICLEEKGVFLRLIFGGVIAVVEFHGDLK